MVMVNVVTIAAYRWIRWPMLCQQFRLHGLWLRRSQIFLPVAGCRIFTIASIYVGRDGQAESG